MKDIIIIANFIAELDGAANSRFIYLAKLLCEQNSVEIIASDFSHGNKASRKIDDNWFPFKITLIHETGYNKNVSFKRFYSHYIWGNNVKKYLTKRKKPDVIYCAVPSLTAAYEASKYCNENSIRYIIDIQDLWPEAFQMVFKLPVISDLVYLPFKIMANKIYRSADEICGVSKSFVARALYNNPNKKNSHVVFLGTDLKSFDRNIKYSKIEKDKNEIWLGYCGSLATSYDIPCVIDSLAILSNRGITVPKFIIMGDGPRRKEFENYAKVNKIEVIFTGKLPYCQMCDLLSNCDIAVNPIVGKSAASIINKHADYAAAGIPVLNTQDSDEYRALINDYHMGFNCKNGDSYDLAEKLEELISNNALRKEMGVNARRCAEERFDRQKTYLELVDAICK